MNLRQMKIENIFAWGFCGSSGREIVNELRASINISEWISDQEGSNDIFALLLGRMPLAVRSVDAVRIFSDFYQKHFPLYNVMINRRGLYYANFHELANEFTLDYYFFYQLITERKPQLIIFCNLPHEGPDYILYQIAKKLGVKTLMCYQSLFPNQFYMTTSIEDFGRFETIPAIFEHPKMVLDDGHKQKVVYMGEVEKQQAIERKSLFEQILYKYSCVCKKQIIFLKRIFILLTNVLLVRPHNLNINSIVRRIVRRLDARDRQDCYEKNINQRVIDRVALRELLITSKHLVYFPLHLQPELTTATLGGVFQDQLYAIESLRSLLGDEWIILVKENPKQGYFQRDKLFFKRISNITGVYLVDKLFPSIEIIKEVVFTATITGTAGWETIKGGGKCLVFGQAWYASLENCLTYHSALTYSELANFLGETKSHEKFRQSFDNFLHKVGTGIVDPDYSELVGAYTDKQNAINVARSLMAVIENPGTIWHIESK